MCVPFPSIGIARGAVKAGRSSGRIGSDGSTGQLRCRPRGRNPKGLAGEERRERVGDTWADPSGMTASREEHRELPLRWVAAVAAPGRPDWPPHRRRKKTRRTLWRHSSWTGLGGRLPPTTGFFRPRNRVAPSTRTGRRDRKSPSTCLVLCSTPVGRERTGGSHTPRRARRPLNRCCSSGFGGCHGVLHTITRGGGKSRIDPWSSDLELQCDCVRANHVGW